MKLELEIALWVNNIYYFVLVADIINSNNSNRSHVVGAYSMPGVGVEMSAWARHLPLGIQGELKQHHTCLFGYRDISSIS